MRGERTGYGRQRGKRREEYRGCGEIAIGIVVTVRLLHGHGDRPTSEGIGWEGLTVNMESGA
jgi:hypothetical protein